MTILSLQKMKVTLYDSQPCIGVCTHQFHLGMVLSRNISKCQMQIIQQLVQA